MRSIEWIDGTLRFIDQTRLPQQEIYVETQDPEIVAEAIRALRIRGAPAIGVASAFAMVLAAQAADVTSTEALHDTLNKTGTLLASTRPTAVNLFVALERMKSAIASQPEAAPDEIRKKLLHEALAIQHEDIDACDRIGILGSTLVDPGSTLLTHCNTGALATAGEGTALSIIKAAAKAGKVVRVYVDETRPLFQGSRLTAWELVKLNIPVTVITDNAAGSVLQQNKVNAIFVGADRIAANGDTANKIGTYPLAVLAARHGVPFYVAAPTSTIDGNSPTGESIRIEERDAAEVTDVGGRRIAAEGVEVFSPAFDVTPNNLITAIVTEKGIIRPPFASLIAIALPTKQPG